ncbi:hypothetical protein Ccrd_009136 [Cynara cardunculus var. scolymus]|uniref:Uncharacterized protein n=1 Tax=Cynara cardunculus var. scolymus TaxID=59895 RepID=A0A103YNP8_CYNCS|nr:hypothetical protein Ccrd_009136 [Cynara cardunculus var. scolymus]
MGYQNAFEVEMVNHEDDSAVIVSSPQICGSQFLDLAIEEARNNKKTLISSMDSVIGFMKEVECEEEAAEQAKEEAAKYSLHILAKVDELKQAQQLAKETNAMVHAREVYAQKAVLATELEELQLRVSSLIKKELADNEKLENERFAREALAKVEEVVEESKRLKQEAVENSKELDLSFSSQTSILSSSSSLKFLGTPYEPRFEIMESLNTPDESIERGDSNVSHENSSDYLLVDSTVLSKNSSSNLENQDQNGSVCRKCRHSVNRIKKRIKVSKEKVILNMFRIKNLKNKAMKKWIELNKDAVTGFCQDDFATDYRADDFDDDKESDGCFNALRVDELEAAMEAST